MQVLPHPTNPSFTEEEVHLAEASSLALLHLLEKAEQSFPIATLRVSVERANGEKTELVLPEATLSLLSTMLKALGRGKNIVVLATDTEVTTQQAANFLKVSRPALVKLLEDGKLPFRKVGSRRRVLIADLLRYKEQEEADRHRGLDELVVEAQKMGMY